MPHPGKPGVGEKEILSRLIGSMDYPDDTIEDVIAGDKFIGLRCGSRLGLSSTLGAKPIKEEQHLLHSITGRTVKETSELLFSETAFSVCAGLAALNVGLKSPIIENPVSAEKVICDRGENNEVVLVGHFPFTGRIRDKVGELNLFELENAPGKTPREQWEEKLKSCSVAAITSTVILTRHLSFFLERAKQAYKLFMGPSTPLSPVLFESGACALAGVRVTDHEQVTAGLKTGMPFHQMKKMGGLDFIYWEKPEQST